MNDSSRAVHRRLNSSAARIAGILRCGIENGELKPGEWLKSTREYAADFGVGRQVIQSAFKLLAEENLIVSRVGSGTHVNPALGFEKCCRIAFAVVGDDLDSVFYHSLYAGLLQQCEAPGCCHSVRSYVNVRRQDLREIGAECDCIILTGMVSDGEVKAARRACRSVLIAGNYILSDSRNMVRMNASSLINNTCLSYLKEKKISSIGLVLGGIHLPVTREYIDTLQRFCAEHDLPWDENSVVCFNSCYGVEDLEFHWGANHAWPKCILTTCHGYIGFTRFLLDNRVPVKEWPSFLVETNDSSFLPLPHPEFHPVTVPSDDLRFGSKLLELAVRLVSMRLNDGFHAEYDPVAGKMSIREA